MILTYRTCPTLKEYATLVRYTRENKAKGMKNEEAEGFLSMQDRVAVG